MFNVVKELEFAASHKLNLPYASPCNEIHGHNYRVIVSISRSKLNANQMVLDFAAIKRTVVDTFDHKHLNDVFAEHHWGDNPTAELLAKYIHELIEQHFLPKEVTIKVRVYETPTSYAEYE